MAPVQIEVGVEVVGRFRQLGEPGRSPASFVAVVAGRTAFVANEELVVLDSDRQARFRQPRDATGQGLLVFAAALGRNGLVLAVHTVPGEAQLRSALAGSLQHTLTGEFGLVQQQTEQANS